MTENVIERRDPSKNDQPKEDFLSAKLMGTPHHCYDNPKKIKNKRK